MIITAGSDGSMIITTGYDVGMIITQDLRVTSYSELI